MCEVGGWVCFAYLLLLSAHLGPTFSNGLGHSGDALAFLSELSNDLRSDLLNEEHPGVEVLLGGSRVLLLLLLGRLVLVRLWVLCALTLETLLVFSSALLIRLSHAHVFKPNNRVLSQ